MMMLFGANLKFTRGDQTSDKPLKFQFSQTDFKSGTAATSRRVQGLVRPLFLIKHPSILFYG